jgi:hypothetical protein
MQLHNELRQILNPYLSWNKARLDCFIAMLLALIKLRHINLTELALAFDSRACDKSRYRRMQRFFSTRQI